MTGQLYACLRGESPCLEPIAGTLPPTVLWEFSHTTDRRCSSTCPAFYKAVATDFEVVRPGSGCGLFNVGEVCSVRVWFCLLDIMLVLNIMGSPWIDQLNAI